MPVGKNAIKRVTNNGYSNVKTKAPDMENSTIIANPSPEVIEKLIPKAEEKKETGAKNPAAVKKPAVAKKPVAAKKPTQAKKTAAPAAKKEKAEKTSDSYVNVGRALPPHLL